MVTAGRPRLAPPRAIHAGGSRKQEVLTGWPSFTDSDVKRNLAGAILLLEDRLGQKNFCARKEAAKIGESEAILSSCRFCDRAREQKAAGIKLTLSKVEM